MSNNTVKLTEEELLEEQHKAEQDALAGAAQAQQEEQDRGEYEAQMAAEQEAQYEAEQGPQGEEGY